jgi:hypothetical protein
MRGFILLGFALLSLTFGLRADDRTQKLAERLAIEARIFEQIAPQLVGRETLHQRVIVAPSRFKVRAGSAVTDPTAAWKESEIVSEYTFAVIGRQIHELRQVTSVDGKAVAGQAKAQEALAKLITSRDDERKKRALEQLEKYGLEGAATDFGQILLLFTRGNLERYEITIAGPRLLGTVPTQVFHYQQLDGPRALTVYQADNSAHAQAEPQHLNVQGEIWVREEDGLPLRITMAATDSTTTKSLREEATVDYALSEFGVLVPVETTHRELRSGVEVEENKFTYSEFHRFEAKP